MADLRTDFLKILRVLNENQVRFVVVVGVAMRLHGSAHITDDLEVGDGFTVHVASLEDLIRRKRAANRPEDQNHLMELEAMRKIADES